MSYLGMVRGLLVIAGFVMLRGLVMVFSRVFMVMCGLLVMLVNFVSSHGFSLKDA